jgi:hypothetical protein
VRVWCSSQQSSPCCGPGRHCCGARARARRALRRARPVACARACGSNVEGKFAVSAPRRPSAPRSPRRNSGTGRCSCAGRQHQPPRPQLSLSLVRCAPVA